MCCINNLIRYTKGDGNTTADATPVVSSSIICQWTGVRLRGLGSALDFLQQPTGFLVVVVLPLLLFFIYELIVFIRKFFEVKNSGTRQITAADEELIKQRAIEEYLRSQQQSQQAPAEPQNTEAKAEEPPAAEAPAAETPAEEAPITEPNEETASSDAAAE